MTVANTSFKRRSVMKRIFIFLSTIVFLSGCGDSGSNEASTNKTITSSWEREDNSATMDFSNHIIGEERSMSLFARDGGACLCSVLILGTDYSGQITSFDCETRVTGNDDSLTCSNAESTLSYEIEDSVLTLCENNQSGNCITLN